MSSFWQGFEKQAGVMRDLGKKIGNLTGVRQLRTGLKQLEHEKKRRGATIGGGMYTTRLGYAKRMENADKLIQSGAGRLAGTAALGGLGAAGTAALASKNKED